MKTLWTDRRVFIAVLGMLLLWTLGFFKAADATMAIATIVGFIAASNASEKIFNKNQKKDDAP